VPKDQIVLFNQVKTTVAKQKVFNDMNAGKVAFLIGSVDKMGTGVNAQRRLYANHNLDPEWLPSSDEQRNGRIIRQGNTNREVRIFDYATKGTYDEQMWGIMARKARFIEGFFRGDPTLRTIEDLGEASTYEQAKALVAKDPRILELARPSWSSRRKSGAATPTTRSRRPRSARRSTSRPRRSERARLALEEADAAKVESIKGDAFKALLNGKSSTTGRSSRKRSTRAQGGHAAPRHQQRRQDRRPRPRPPGQRRGADRVPQGRRHRRRAPDRPQRRSRASARQRPAGVEARYIELSTANTAVSAQAALTKLARRPEGTKARIAQLDKQQREFEERAADIKPYEGLPRIRELQEQTTRLTNELDAENKAAEAKKQQRASRQQRRARRRGATSSSFPRRCGPNPRTAVATHGGARH
jgi:hypothetical protein